jgi:hypothetical protein
MGTRYAADILTPTTLSFIFLKGRVAYDAYSVDSVTIHDSYEDALADDNIIETITTIDHTVIGTYVYEAEVLDTPGTYFDKVFVTPTSTGDQISFIGSFYVATQSESVDNCIVYGDLKYSNGDPVVSALVYAIPAGSPSISSTGYGISPVPIQVYSNEDGLFEIVLMRNTYFIVTISSIGYRQKILVPDSSTYNLFTLSSISMNNSPMPVPVNPEW